MESINKPFFIPYFFEGLIFISVCLYLIFSNFYYELRRAVINPNFFIYDVFWGNIDIINELPVWTFQSWVSAQVSFIVLPYHHCTADVFLFERKKGIVLKPE